jgi:ABC-type nitrate/sulfonate/bicarbonate transport system substrate-binding protein
MNAIKRKTMPVRFQRRLAWLCVIGWGALVMPAAAWAQAQVQLGSLGPPSNASYLLPIIKAYGLDKKHGVELTNTLYPDPSNLYTDFAAHRFPVTVGGFFNAANFYTRGMKIKLLTTLATANHAIVAKGDIKTAADLSGKRLAATTGSGFYALAQIYFRQHGLDTRQNLSIVPGAPVAVQTQLLAGRADAGLLYEPLLSNMLNQGYQPVGDMNGDIRKELKLPPSAPIWFIGIMAWQDWIDEDPARPVKLMEMLQDAVAVYDSKPAEVDPLISEFAKVPVAALKSSRERGLSAFKVVPAIQERETIDALLAGFKSVEFIQAVPDAGIYYTWPNLPR